MNITVKAERNTCGAVPYTVTRTSTSPAVELHTYDNGVEAYYKSGVRHRTNGPAVTHPDGYAEWHFNGKMTKVRYPDGTTHIFV